MSGNQWHYAPGIPIHPTFPTVTLRTRKVRNNPLLRRKQMVVEIRHWGRCGVPKSEIREKLADLYKTVPEVVICFGFRSQWGGGRTIGFALIYDSIDFAKKFEPKCRQVRHGLREKKRRPGTMQQRKDTKNIMKRIRGVRKSRVPLARRRVHCMH